MENSGTVLVQPKEQQSLQSPSNDANLSLDKLKSILSKLLSWRVIKTILFGQVLSLLICCTGIISKYIEKYNANVPVFQNFPVYILFGLSYTLMLACKTDEDGNTVLCKILRKSSWKYFIIAVADVEANYMIVKAYHFTTYSSVQLLDSFAIVVVMILSCYFLKLRYKIVHFSALVISLIGVGCMVTADYIINPSQSAAVNMLAGDFLVLGAATCYAISNVAMEFVSKSEPKGFVRILGMLGLFCPFIAGIQTIILEREILFEISWSWPLIGLFAAYTCTMFLYYTLMPLVMVRSSATAVNISILTADPLAIIVGYYLFDNKFSPLYVVSILMIIFSLIIYNSQQPRSLREVFHQDSENQEAYIESNGQVSISSL